MKTYLVILLIIFSLFMGISLGEKGWWFLWQFELREIPLGIFEKPHIFFIYYLFLVTSHCAIFSLLFFKIGRLVRMIAIVAPGIFILSYYLIIGWAAVIVLIPFIIVWMISIFKSRDIKTE